MPQQARKRDAVAASRRRKTMQPPKRPRVQRGPSTEGDDAVRKLAEKHWPANETPSPFESSVVEQVYSQYLSRPARGRECSARLIALELSGYLERYLWPNLVEPLTASWEHIMSIVALVNLKAREGAPAWAAFQAEPERFGAFFSRVLDLATESSPRASYATRTAWTAFLVTAFASLEDSMVRSHALRLVSLPMWTTLAPKHLQQQLVSRRSPLRSSRTNRAFSIPSRPVRLYDRPARIAPSPFPVGTALWPPFRCC
jgi:hypothetical protein